MKIFIIIAHILLGVLLIFYSFNSLMRTYSSINSPNSGWSAEYVENLKHSLPSTVAESVGGAVLGLLSILGALAFRKDKRWAMFTLPIVTMVLILEALIPLLMASAGGDKASYAWTGDIIVLYALILLVFFISETAYIVLKKRTQLN